MATWTIDQAHSQIGFKIKHLMVSTVRGSFTDFSGTVETEGDSFENAKVSFAAQVKSINTQNEMRDGHLTSAELFDAEKYPTISFKSTSFVKNGDGYDVTGDFTMKDVTKSITLNAITEGIGTGMDGKSVTGFDITGKINRDDFGLTYNIALETGGVVIGNEVTLDIHVELVEA